MGVTGQVGGADERRDCVKYVINVNQEENTGDAAALGQAPFKREGGREMIEEED